MKYIYICVSNETYLRVRGEQIAGLSCSIIQLVGEDYELIINQEFHYQSFNYLLGKKEILKLLTTTIEVPSLYLMISPLFFTTQSSMIIKGLKVYEL